MSYVYGYRELRGCLPPAENQTKFRVYWREISEGKIVFFMRAWIKDFELWAPADSMLYVVHGGSRVPVHQFDRGVNSIHTVVRYNNEADLVIQLEVRDHRSFQVFTPDQLSNLEGEKNEPNVEHTI